MKLNIFSNTIFTLILAILVSNCSLNPSSGIAPSVLSTQTITEPTISTRWDVNLSNHCITPTTVQKWGDVQETIVTFDKDNRLSLWNPSLGQKNVLGRVEILYGALSNGQELAYLDRDSHQLILISPSGIRMATKSVPETWVEILGRLGAEKILISNMPLSSNGGWKPPSSTISLDLSTGSFREFHPEYPEIYSYGSGPPNFGRYSYSITAYDPKLTRVVYPSTTNTSMSIVLWDILNHRRLADLIAPFPWNEPVWRDDGASFIISVPPMYEDRQGNTFKNDNEEVPYMGGNELFEMERDGKSKRLTYLTTKYVAEQRSYTWSPDWEWIAFWLKTGEGMKWELATLNIKTGEITNYCVDGGSEPSYDIFWLPTGNRIISTISYAEGGRRVLLVDFEKKVATFVPEDEVIVGWMAGNP